MRKKIKALLAITLTLCLTMGMSTFAASPVDPPVRPSYPTTGSMGAVDKDGNRVTVKSEAVSEEVKKVLEDKEQVKNIIKDAGYKVPDNAEVVVMGSANLTITEMPEGGIDVELWYNGEDLKAGQIVYVLHQKADGTWEVLEGTITINGSVKVHLDSLSPVAIVKIMSDGTVITLEKTAGASTPAATKKSPKTGE